MTTELNIILYKNPKYRMQMWISSPRQGYIGDHIMKEFGLEDVKGAVNLYVKVDGGPKQLEFDSVHSLPRGCDDGQVVDVYLVHKNFESSFMNGDVLGDYDSDLKEIFTAHGSYDVPPPYREWFIQ
ncbi:hypothetical protein GGF42_007201 [Coemansia sp. RSA 2424]|nr:hypothetical protein GGF42_007201 [Coemansia sp. RSA 2424]